MVKRHKVRRLKGERPAIDSYIVNLVRYRLQRIFSRIPLSAVIWAAVLLVFLVVVYWKVPDAVPGLMQRGLGIIFAALVAAVYFQATREQDMQDDILVRMHKGQHLDFGKQLRAEKHERLKVNLPILGETTVRSIVGIPLVAVSFCWWLTPLAPVAVAEKQIKDVSGLLTEEILAVTLVRPDGVLVTAQPPSPPMEARRLAAEIPEKAPAITLARKAISQGKYDLALQHLISAATEEDADRLEIDLTRAQCEMFAGDFKEAAVWYKNALDCEPKNPTILAQASLAALHAGDYHKAQQFIAQALTICRAAQPQETFRLATCLEIQAALFTIVAYRFDIVEKHNRQAMDIWADEEFPEFHPAKAACFNNMGVLFSLTGNPPGARSMSAWGVDIWKRLEKNSPQLAAGLGNEAMRLLWEGRYAESQLAAEKQLVMLRNTLPIGHAAIAMGIDATAMSDLAMGDYQRTDPEDIKVLVTTFEKKLGPTNPAVAAAMNTVAESYLAVALPSMARSYYEQALEATEASLGAKHPYMAQSLLGLCRVFLRQEKYDQAMENCLRARQIVEDVLEKNSVMATRCIFWEAKIHLARGEADKAKPLFEQVLETTKKRFGDEHPLAADSLGCLASLENGPRTVKDGIAHYEEALAMYERLLGAPLAEQHPAAAQLLFGMAKLTAEKGETDAALALLARTLDIQEKTLVPYDPELADTLAAQAALLRKKQPPQADLAAALEKRAEEIRREYEKQNRH